MNNLKHTTVASFVYIYMIHNFPRMVIKTIKKKENNILAKKKKRE